MNLVKVVLAIMSLVCLLDMPYGYYQLYRFTAMGAFFYLAYAEQEKKEWMVVWIVSGLLVQPFFKVALGRNIWNFVDVIWAVLLIVSIFSKPKQEKIN